MLVCITSYIISEKLFQTEISPDSEENIQKILDSKDLVSSEIVKNRHQIAYVKKANVTTIIDSL
jgi:hypothetical protein